MVLAQMVDALFRNTLAPWQWGVLAFVPLAVIALYFLKLKRQPLEVPSTYLWKRSIEDLHVNSLWQRLRQSILLYLQLLLLALAMLALVRPGWLGTKLEGQRFIFLVDNSASMQAADAEKEQNRLAEAKRRARALIDQLESGMTAMIISFSESPRVVQQFTDNRQLLRERLESIQPTFGTTNLKGALQLADGLANPSRITVEEEGEEVDVVEAQEATLFIFSDGRFEDVKGFSLGNLKPIYVPIGTVNADNLAITACNTRRSEIRPDQRQAFVQLVNFTDSRQQVVVEISLDGQFLDAQQVDVPALDSAGVVFPLADAPPGSLEAKLSYKLSTGEVRDVLELDDTAYAALDDSQPGRVLVVSPGNPVLDIVLATERTGRLATIEDATPDYLNGEAYTKLAAAGECDLVIYDQCAPEEMPRMNTLFIGRRPPGPAWPGRRSDSPSAENPQPERAVLPQIIDWNRGHPLLSHVEFGNVDIVESYVLELPSGGDVLIDSTAGPVAAIAPRDSYQDLVLGFEILGKNDQGETTINTNWPRRHSFPTFFLNALEYLAGQADLAGSGAVSPGKPVELRVPGNVNQITVTRPDGKSQTVRRDPHDVFQFHDTQLPGTYQVHDRGNVIQRFAVNLFDRDESDVRLKPSQDTEAEDAAAAIRIGNIDVAAFTGSAPARKEIWKPLLIGALAVLLFEWYVYNRRVYL